jgi:hypothetical protein
LNQKKAEIPWKQDLVYEIVPKRSSIEPRESRGQRRSSSGQGIIGERLTKEVQPKSILVEARLKISGRIRVENPERE